MFEDETQQPEDMFENTDKVAPQVTPPTEAPMAAADQGEAAAQPAMAAPPVQPTPFEEASRTNTGGGKMKVVVLIVGIIVIVGAAFALSMRILGSRTAVTPDVPAIDAEVLEEAMQVQTSDPEPAVEADVEPTPDPEPVPEVQVDTDKDGLTDEEEAELGTSPTSEDTDSDGLFDREEVMTWETDPLNADTDGDGYLDGAEVNAGYNPNGEGELKQIPTTSG